MGARRELSLRRNKGQSVNSVMKRMGLFLGIPEASARAAGRSLWKLLLGTDFNIEITSWY